MQPSTVLFLAANPVQVQPLQLGEECRAIEDKIRAAKFRDQIRFRSRWAARPADLLQALNEDIPKVLHFSGHGTGDQGLCFQSEDGSPLHMSTDVLTQIMRAAGASVTVVVLNTCYSEVQAKALVAHVPCVIGMSDAIGDGAAIIYAESFYCALASGRSVANAHEQGIVALGLPMSSGQTRDVKLAGVAQCALTPRLLTRPDIDAGCIYIVHGPMKARCVVVIKATLREFNADVLARVTEELRQLTGDLSLQITDVDEGSVRLRISLSSASIRKLMELRGNGQLTQICGFDVSAVSELRAEEKEARVAVDVARIISVRRQGHAVMHQGLAGMDLPGWTGADARGQELVLSSAWVDAEPALKRLAKRLCEDSVDADDLLQDTFERAVRQGMSPDIRSTGAWLSTIMHNLFVDRCRAAARHPSHEALEDKHTNVAQLEPDIPEPAWTRITVQDIRDALDQVDQVYRDVYVLHTFEHLSVEQIAQQLSIQRITVGTRLNRARKRLREVLVKRFGLEAKP